jgi:hypothetical protein
MQGSPFFRTGDVVTHCDVEGVAPISFKEWSRKRSVDKERTSGHAMEHTAVGNIEMINTTHSKLWCYGVRIGIANSGIRPRKAVWKRIVG